MDKTKVCPRCGKDKDTSEYSQDKNRKGGLAYACKPCANEVAKDYSSNRSLVFKQVQVKFPQILPLLMKAVSKEPKSLREAKLTFEIVKHLVTLLQTLPPKPTK